MGEHSKSPSRKPVKKVTAATAAGAVVVIGVWVASLFGVEAPDHVADAATVLAVFAGGYLKRP